MEREDAEVFYFSDEGLGNVLLHKHHTIIRQDTLRCERMVLYFMPEYLHEVLSENHLDEHSIDTPVINATISDAIAYINEHYTEPVRAR